MKLLLKYIFLVIGISLICFSFWDKKFKIDNQFINQKIKEKEKITIKKLGTQTEINSFRLYQDSINGISADINFNFNSPIVNLINKDATLKLLLDLKNNKLYITILDIKFKNLDTNDVYDKSLENVKEKAENVTNKLNKYLKNKIDIDKVGEKIKDNVVIDKEEISKVIKNVISSEEIKIYSLGFYGLLINDISINNLDNNNFNIEFVINKTLFLILGIIIVFFSLLKEILLFSIKFYQKHLSKRKNYKCARGVVTGDGTCSSIVRKKLEEDGAISAINEYFKTTKKCKEDYEIYKKEKENKNKNNLNGSSNNSDCCNWLPTPSGCGGSHHGGHTDSCDCGGGDCSPCN